MKDNNLFDELSWDELDEKAGFTNKPISDGGNYIRKTQDIELNIDWDTIINDPIKKPKGIILQCINCKKEMDHRKGRKFCSDRCRKQLKRQIYKHHQTTS